MHENESLTKANEQLRKEVELLGNEMNKISKEYNKLEELSFLRQEEILLLHNDIDHLYQEKQSTESDYLHKIATL